MTTSLTTALGPEFLGANVPCSLVNTLTSDYDQCNFVIRNDCQQDDGLDYVYFVYCIMGGEYRYWAIVIVTAIILVLFSALSCIADEFLCPCLLSVAKTLRMSDSLAVSSPPRSLPLIQLP